MGAQLVRSWAALLLLRDLYVAFLNQYRRNTTNFDHFQHFLKLGIYLEYY